MAGMRNFTPYDKILQTGDFAMVRQWYEKLNHLSEGIRSGAFLVMLPVLASSGAIPVSSLRVDDISDESRFQDAFLDHFKRGRALLAADFDLDGRIDFYIGNVGEESFVIVSTVGPEGPLFELGPVLLEGPVAWAAATADYDNDGDYDIFVCVGGNETVGFDVLFQNQRVEAGELEFLDVTEQAGVAGPVPEGETEPLEVASAGARWIDYDRDGNVDLYVSVNTGMHTPPDHTGRNILWHNNGDGTFTDVTNEVNLGTSLRSSQHSTFLDIDNDGDADLYESNIGEDNVLWRNLLVETGIPDFEDVTAEFSGSPDEDLRFPMKAFASGSADFNSDGWEDIIVFMRGSGPEIGSPYPAGHALFLNQGGEDFVNVAHESGLNDRYESVRGVMGCQVGDLNADGFPDVFFGNGGPGGGQFNQLFITVPDRDVEQPLFLDRSDLIDFPAPVMQDIPPELYPPYPYRTHGTDIVDVDGDGLLEMAVANGGPAAQPDIVREPNRLFTFRPLGGALPHFFTVQPVGDGVSVSTDAIGTRLALTVSAPGGESWTIHRTLNGGNCFSAQNGFVVHFGLSDADTIHRLDVAWPDGTNETLTEGLEVNSGIVLAKGS